MKTPMMMVMLMEQPNVVDVSNMLLILWIPTTIGVLSFDSKDVYSDTNDGQREVSI